MAKDVKNKRSWREITCPNSVQPSVKSALTSHSSPISPIFTPTLHKRAKPSSTPAHTTIESRHHQKKDTDNVGQPG